MNDSMDELEKHYLRYDRPHVYTCSCGVVMYWHPDGSQKLAEKPDKIEYLPCGHAACGKTEHFDCIICMMKG